MTNWYFSESLGKDSNGGNLPNDPKRNLSVIPTLGIARGDTIYLLTGDVWRGQSIVLPTLGAGAGQVKITYYVLTTFKGLPIVDGSVVFEGLVAGTPYVLNENFESWSGPTSPSNWTFELLAGGAPTSTISKETTTVHSGTNSIKFSIAAAETVALSQEFTGLSDHTTYKLSQFTHHGTFTANEEVRIFIKRTATPGGATGEWYDWTTKEWNTATGGVAGWVLDLGAMHDTVWKFTSYDVQTGTNISNYQYYTVYYVTEEDGAPIGKHWFLDSVTFGEAGLVTENLVKDPSFESWNGPASQTYWKPIQKTNTVLQAFEDHVVGDNCVLMETDEKGSDVGLQQSGIALVAGESYQVGIFHHFLQSSNNDTGYVGIQLIQESTGYYWTGTKWTETETDWLVDKHTEWDLMNGIVAITKTDNYTFKVHRGLGKGGVQYEEMWFDNAFIKKVDPDAIYRAYTPSEPVYVYLSGVHWGVTNEVVRLKKTSNTLDPPPFCYTYKDGTVKVNLDKDPMSVPTLVVEGSVIDYNIDTNENSYVDVDYLVCRCAAKDGIYIREGSSAAPTTFNITNTLVQDPGFGAVTVGYRPTPPAVGGSAPTADSGWTPINVTVTNVDVTRYNRDDRIRIPLSGTDWYNGWIVPSPGIGVSQGTQNPPGGDANTFSKLSVWGDKAKINYSAGRNGIAVKHGTDVLITECLVRDADHAITGVGAVDAAGRILRLRIIANRVIGTGDDGIFVLGMSLDVATKPSVIAYNVLEDCGDNGVDNMNSLYTEIYNNLFINTVNEQITVWGVVSLSGKNVASNAFILNNAFVQWGKEGWRSGAFKRRGVAIGLGTGNSQLEIDLAEDTLKKTVIQGNVFYHKDSGSTEDAQVHSYPFHVAEVQKTFAQMQALGLPSNNKVADPQLLKTTYGSVDSRPGGDSPLFNYGVDLTTLSAEIELMENWDVPAWRPVSFNTAAETGLIDQDSVWPGSVTKVTQGSQPRATGWNSGPWSTEKYRVQDTAASFPVDYSLIGLTVYVVDSTYGKIWGGKITSNTATELVVDAWVPAFNATGKPYGLLSYYLGPIYVYDKTGIFVPFSDGQDANIMNLEMFQKKLDEYPEVYYKLQFNDGEGVSVSGKMDRIGTRLSSHQGGGYSRNVQVEHAAVTGSGLAIKSLSIALEWADGKSD